MGAPEPGWANVRLAVGHCHPVGRVDESGLRASNLIFLFESGVVGGDG